MSFLKTFYWNYQSKLNYLVNKTFHNLNNKQCESSYIILLSCNLNMEINKNPNNVMDEDCYIVDDTEISKGNNITNSTTVLGTTATTSGHANSCNSSNIPSVCTGRGRYQQNYKESSSINLTNRQNSSPYLPINNRKNDPNLILNPLKIGHLINYHSFYQSRGLSLLDVAPPVYNEQRFNYSTQRFSNASLFSEQDTVSPNTEHQRYASTNALNWKETKDREIVSDLRTWIPVNANLSSNPGIQFTLMSYNVLAQDLLVEHGYLYRKHQPRALLWETRWKNLYEEILKNNADIICLQEVQDNHLENYFSKLLKKGYAHMYKKKTGMRSDGCAIYYKKSLFKLLENTTVEYNQEYPVLDRDNVAIIAKFAPVSNLKSEFVVATTHLLYNPKREDVRLAQTQILLGEIDRIAYKKDVNSTYIPVIITGDFNSEPESAVHRLLVNGTLKYDILTNRTLKETDSTAGLEGRVLIPSFLRVTDKCQHLDLLKSRLAGEKLTRAQEIKLINIRHNKRETHKPNKTDPDDETLFSTGVLSHDLKLQSAFLYRIHNDTEGTTYQNRWVTVDYIFYSGAFNEDLNRTSDDKLKLISRYSIPTTTELTAKVRYIPNFALGSDHLSILAKFKLEF